MMKFIKERDPNNNFDLGRVELSVDNPDASLPEIMDVFIRFLEACTYSTNQLKKELSITNEDLGD